MGSIVNSLKSIDAAVAGHICFDIIPRFSDTGITDIAGLLTPGKLVQVGEAALSTGGPVSNTGIGLRIFGVNVLFMAKVGDDEIGQLIIKRLKSQGHAEGVKTASREASSYTIALAPPGIDRIFLHNPGTNNTFTSHDIDYSLVEKCGLFHLGYPPLMRALYSNGGAELVECFRKAKKAGATTSLDMCLPDPKSESGKIDWRSILEKLLPYVDIFLPSIEEAYSMMKPDEFWKRRDKVGGGEIINDIAPEEYSALAKGFIEMGCRMTALKTAHRGFYFRTGAPASFEKLGAAKPASPENWANKELWAPAFLVPQIASATGSGDSSIAGFLSAYLRGYSLERCLVMANVAGHLNLLELDALSGLRPWEEVTALVDSGALTPIDPNIKTQGWNFDKS
ncbi:carbohydrate kinase family protein, partial [Candidatus Sumerlaeota bacterium]|nr:carbohydrate kinase family protein [Candidatus Sumerlaeota bacterium]